MKFLIFFLLSLSSLAFGQTQDQVNERIREIRSRMMEEMNKMFDDDSFMSDDFFGSNMHPFDNINRLKRSGGQNVTIEEKNEKDGSISVLITPQNKNVSLDISTENNLITIKTETKIEETHEESGNTSRSMSASRSQRSIQIPRGFRALSPKQEGKSIKITLTPEKHKKKNDKVPVKKRAGEITI